MFDFYRVCAAVPNVAVADVAYNKAQIMKKIEEARALQARLVCFPELALSGYTCGDLFLQSALLEESKAALREILELTKEDAMMIIMGMPLLLHNALYNVACVLYQGVLQGVSVKTFLPNYNEFYERRWFSSAEALHENEIPASLVLGELAEDYYVPIGNDLIYEWQNAFTFGIEICEDLWAPITPSTYMATAGAELIVNLSASNDIIGKREYRQALVKNKSISLMCDYLYVSAGAGESTTDLIFSGHSMLYENGKKLMENETLADDDYLLTADMDLGRIRADRVKGKTYEDSARVYGGERPITNVVISNKKDVSSDGSYFRVTPHPFIPKGDRERKERCVSIFQMQVGGLAKRLAITGGKMVIGVSGGMDSTLALLVGAQALKKLNLPMTNLVGITMPAFGTTDRTYNNSLMLMESLGIEQVTIPIKDACIQHYKDIGHDMERKDVTFENVQARERTQVLMDYANKVGAIVVGTGDLSELALGWCTYNADQMSMYGVNASIPKTLVKWMIASVVEENIFPKSTEVLRDIIATPISPELLPPDENGEIAQKTEDFVGPYELHDFYLYYMMRYGYGPDKIFYLARKAFDGKYEDAVIKKWLQVFYRRFFSQQFKRSCMPDGVKVGSVCLSPRGDWRMPSDASANLWLSTVEML